MKNKVINILGIAGMLILVGCSGGDIGSIVDTKSSDDDILTITKQSNEVFTINWNKRYDGYSEVIYDEIPDDRGGAQVMTDNYNGIHNVVCELTSFYDNKVNYLCEGSGPAYDGSTRVIRKGLTMKADTSYYFSLNYGLDRVNQGPEYELTYTSSRTLIVDEY